MGLVVVEDTDSTGIMVEDNVLVETTQADTMAALIQLAFFLQSSFGRYPWFSLAAVEVLYSLFHHGLLV